MFENISTTIRKARKDHTDDAGIWIYEDLRGIVRNSKLTFSELRAIAKLKANNWKILKGQTYSDNVCKYDGYIYSFKCLPEINKICMKLKLYDDYL